MTAHLAHPPTDRPSRQDAAGWATRAAARLATGALALTLAGCGALWPTLTVEQIAAMDPKEVTIAFLDATRTRQRPDAQLLAGTCWGGGVAGWFNGSRITSYKIGSHPTPKQLRYTHQTEVFFTYEDARTKKTQEWRANLERDGYGARWRVCSFAKPAH